MNKQRYTIAVAGSKTSKNWKNTDFTWDALVSKLRNPKVTSETVEEYHSWKTGEDLKKKDAAKDCGGFVGGALKQDGQRTKANVQDRCLVTLDADHAYPGQWEDVTLLCEYKMLMYSTHSHTPESPRVRFVIPLDRPVSPLEYCAISRKLAVDIGLETLDRTTFAPERLMYWSSKPSDGEFLFECQDGEVVCADKVLRSYGSHDEWKNSENWPHTDAEDAAVQYELKQAGDPLEKPGLMGVFNRVFPISEAIDRFLPDVYESAGYGIGIGGKEVYNYLLSVSGAGGGVLVYDDALLFSYHDTDPCGGGLHCFNAFDLVRVHKFDPENKENPRQDVTRRESYKAMLDFVQDLPEIKKQIADEREAAVLEEFGDLGMVAEKRFADAGAETEGEEVAADDIGEGAEEKGDTAQTEAPEEDDKWKKLLKYKPRTTELAVSLHNVELILTHDPILKGAFAYNKLLNRDVIKKPVPWHPVIHNKEDGDCWTDRDHNRLYLHMERAYGLQCYKEIDMAWGVVCDDNAFHPVQDYLNGLKWDGVERLDTLMVRYFNASDTPYTRAVTRKFFAATAARMLVPGIKFDNVLTLVGKQQGLGKSTFGDIMARGRFSDSIGTLGTKESREALFGIWIAELPELASWKKADNDSVKAFLAARQDRFRVAYGRHTSEFPRQCTFLATTNEESILRDRSGNRRYWPVKVKGDLDKVAEKGALPGLAEEVDMLWAEAVHRFREGEKLYMDSAELRRLAEEQQAAISAPDELEGRVIEYLDMRLPRNWETLGKDDRISFCQGRSPLDMGTCDLRRDLVCLVEIRLEGLGMPENSSPKGEFSAYNLANIMDNLPDWEKMPKKVRIKGYGPQYTYRRVVGGKADESAPRYVVDPLEQ